MRGSLFLLSSHMDTKNITEQIETFRVALENMLLEYRNARFPTLPAPTVEISTGKRFARIIKKDGGHWGCRSTARTHSRVFAYGFIDLSNGDLLKAASWKAPAMHARGNIFNQDILSGCGPYGMAYLK